MSEEKKVTDDQDLSEEEKVDASQEEDQTSEEKSEEDVEALRQAKKELTIRAKKAEEKLKTLKSSSDDKEDKKPKEETSEIDDILDLQAKGYSPAEIKTIKTYSKRMDLSFGEVLQDPYIKSGIEAERSRTQTQEATPSPSSKVYSVGDTKKSFREMNKDEAKDAFNKLNLSKKLK